MVRCVHDVFSAIATVAPDADLLTRPALPHSAHEVCDRSGWGSLFRMLLCEEA